MRSQIGFLIVQMRVCSFNFVKIVMFITDTGYASSNLCKDLENRLFSFLSSVNQMAFMRRDEEQSGQKIELDTGFLFNPFY